MTKKERIIMITKSDLHINLDRGRHIVRFKEMGDNNPSFI